MITLRFVGHTGPAADAIRRANQGFWAVHAEAFLPNIGLLGAHYTEGVAILPVGWDHKIVTQELYVDLHTPPEVQTIFENFLRAQIGKPYDTHAIAAMAWSFITGMPRDWRAPDTWFCSELIAAGLEECVWLRPLATGLSHISPRDLLLAVSTRVTVGIPAPS